MESEQFDVRASKKKIEKSEGHFDYEDNFSAESQNRNGVVRNRILPRFPADEATREREPLKNRDIEQETTGNETKARHSKQTTDERHDNVDEIEAS
ncbi:hypothetical protein TNCT_15551 [Trichonephila clavata]|uniref:Uncharacterized protein n=1 Tax=Trichonephila clavata TaxID=2740835 RepID=A0A8X6G1Q5_TRICU|nr:hypothetical protein TNCT_15551 [Trichonephila clavata]